MLAFDIPCIHSGHQGGNPIQRLCWGSGGTDAMCAKYCCIKACHFTVQAALSEPSRNRIRSLKANTGAGFWVFGFQFVTVSNSDKIWHPAALDWADCEKEILHNSGSLHLLLVSAWALEEGSKEEKNLPLSAAPSSLWLSPSNTHRDSHASFKNVSLKVVSVLWFEHGKLLPYMLLKSRTRQNKALCDFKTLITHSTAICFRGILNSMDATQVG